LVLLAIPLTWRRMVLVTAVLAGFVLLLSLPLARGFYALGLPRSELDITLLIAGFGVASIVGFWVISRRRPAATPGGSQRPRPAARP
jgi:membrane protease YdiL (CAAX protease family)